MMWQINTAADGGNGDKLPGQPYPGPHQPPSPDGGPGVPNPPKAHEVTAP
ncbi:hypothetical protein ACI2L4_09025 [Streptomyces sparsogenes]